MKLKAANKTNSFGSIRFWLPQFPCYKIVVDGLNFISICRGCSFSKHQKPFHFLFSTHERWTTYFKRNCLQIWYVLLFIGWFFVFIVTFQEEVLRLTEAKFHWGKYFVTVNDVINMYYSAQCTFQSSKLTLANDWQHISSSYQINMNE